MLAKPCALENSGRKKEVVEGALGISVSNQVNIIFWRLVFLKLTLYFISDEITPPQTKTALPEMMDNISFPVAVGTVIPGC